MKTKTQISTMHKLKSLALVGVLAAVGAVTAQAQNVIVNGDFTANASLFNEQTGLPSTGYINNPAVPSGNPSVIPGWDLLYSQMGWGISYGLNGPATSLPGVGMNVWGPASTSGFNYIWIYPASLGVASQVLSLAPNTTYQLDFDVAQTATSAAFSYHVDITDGATVYFTTTAVANNLAFDHISATFTTGVSALNPTISLQNVDGDYQHAIDFANVSVAVPEPTTAALTGLGIVLAGAGRWARRRNA